MPARVQIAYDPKQGFVLPGAIKCPLERETNLLVLLLQVIALDQFLLIGGRQSCQRLGGTLAYQWIGIAQLAAQRCGIGTSVDAVNGLSLALSKRRRGKCD